MIFIFGITGSLISRLHGGGFFDVPKTIKNMIWALPFALATFYFTHNYYFTVLAFALCLLKSMGHGRGFRLHETMYPDDKPEAIEKIIPDFLPLYWYKVSIMALTGLAAVSGAAIAIGYVDVSSGLIIAIGGLLKGLAYMIGQEVTKKYPTEIGELLTGFFAFSALYLAVI